MSVSCVLVSVTGKSLVATSPPVPISRPFDTGVKVAVPTIFNVVDFRLSVVEGHRVTDLLAECRERLRTEHDLIGRVQAVPGEQRRPHLGAGRFGHHLDRLAIQLCSGKVRTRKCSDVVVVTERAATWWTGKVLLSGEAR